MNQYMADSVHTELDPRDLILDPVMQARDTGLIKDSKYRQAQEIKQKRASQEMLEDLRNGVGIKVPITVFEVDSEYYVVDGFHRVGACLDYLKESKDDKLKVKALLIINRTYTEAFLMAQEANQSHGVGITSDEIQQSKFRALVVSGQFDLSVSEVEEKVGCSRGQANHITKALGACKKVLYGKARTDSPLNEVIELLQDGLNQEHTLTASVWDSKGFPKIRKLSDAVRGINLPLRDLDNEEYAEHQINDGTKAISRLIENIGEDYFREALRRAIRGQGLGISVSQRKKWLEQAGSVSGDEKPENWDKSSSESTEIDGF